jgi:hypothetical protein
MKMPRSWGPCGAAKFQGLVTFSQQSVPTWMLERTIEYVPGGRVGSEIVCGSWVGVAATNIEVPSCVLGSEQFEYAVSV